MSTAPDSLLDGSFGLEWLMRQEFPPLRFLIDGILPEGVSIIAGPPKVAKSWFVLDLALSLAAGTPTLGSVPGDAPRPVLYLALEDGPRRLQSRISKIGAPLIKPGMITFKTSVHPGFAVPTIREFMERHDGESPVVFVDTLAKIKPAANHGVSEYQADYAVMGAFKNACHDFAGSSISLVHHTRKMEATDFSDTVSGTQGITGGADATLVLRRPRNEQSGTLLVTSRDAPEGEYSVTFDGTRWTLDGGTPHDASNIAREKKATAGLGDRMAEVVQFVGKRAKTTAGDVADVLGIEKNQARSYLSRAHESGRIGKDGRGVYVGVASVASVAFTGDDTQDATHATHATPTHVGGCSRHPVTPRPEWCADCRDPHSPDDPEELGTPEQAGLEF